MDIMIILLLIRRHLSFRYFVVDRDRCTSPRYIGNIVKQHACTASDRIQKKATSTFPTNLSCKTTSIVHHQSYLEYIVLLKFADDMLVVRMQRCLARCMVPWHLRLASCRTINSFVCDYFVKSNKHIQLLPDLYSTLLSLTTV